MGWAVGGSGKRAGFEGAVSVAGHDVPGINGSWLAACGVAGGGSGVRVAAGAPGAGVGAAAVAEGVPCSVSAAMYAGFVRSMLTCIFLPETSKVSVFGVRLTIL